MGSPALRAVPGAGGTGELATQRPLVGTLGETQPPDSLGPEALGRFAGQAGPAGGVGGQAPGPRR